jgi:CHASE2 domain-containing sensor protein
MLKNKRFILILLWQGVVLWMLCSYIMITFVKDGTRVDYHTNDFLINTFRSSILSIPDCKQIVYLTINDKTYKDFFLENKFNRKLFAEGLLKLKEYNPEAIIIDLIFAYPSDLLSDSFLVKRLKEFDNVFLPVSFSLGVDSISAVKDNNELAAFRIKKFLDRPKFLNEGEPYKAGRGILTADKFLATATGIGHISDFPDEDGIYRHSILLVELDSLYLPSLYFSAFLDDINVPLEKILIDWGNKIIIPALPDSWINRDIEIPIDFHGRTRIPFVDKWSEDFKNISFTSFYKLSNNPEAQGKLLDFFEGKFVIIGDVSTGIADMGNTSLNQTSPLISIQANMLNALLTNTFFYRWNSVQIVILLLALITILTLSTFFNDIKIFYSSFVILLLFVVALVLFQITKYSILPFISILISIIFSFIVLLIQVQYFTQRGKKYAEIENLKKEHEMDEAKKIQLSMLPDVLPKIDSLEIDTYMSTAAIVGGDYYDFFLDESQNLKFVIADATGHGLKAGTMVTVVKTLFVYIRDEINLDNVLNKMSAIIKKLKLPKLYVCLSFFIYRDYVLEFTSAGMPPVLIYRHNSGEVETITQKGMPLGHITNFPYTRTRIKLLPGDTILICSDGLTELFNEKNEMLETENLILLLQKVGTKSPKEIINEINQLARQWSGKTEPKDDVTIIVVKIK